MIRERTKRRRNERNGEEGLETCSGPDPDPVDDQERRSWRMGKRRQAEKNLSKGSHPESLDPCDEARAVPEYLNLEKKLLEAKMKKMLGRNFLKLIQMCKIRWSTQ